MWLCEWVALRALLEIRDGRLVNPDNMPDGTSHRIKAEALQESAERLKISYGQLYELTHRTRKRITYGLAERLWAAMESEELRTELLALLFPPAVLARRRMYAEAVKAERAMWDTQYPVPSRVTPFGEASEWFRRQSRARGKLPSRLLLAEIRALCRLEAFPRLQRLPRESVVALLKASLRAELMHLEAEYGAYKMMYGGTESVTVGVEPEDGAAEFPQDDFAESAGPVDPAKYPDAKEASQVRRRPRQPTKVKRKR